MLLYVRREQAFYTPEDKYRFYVELTDSHSSVLHFTVFQTWLPEGVYSKVGLIHVITQRIEEFGLRRSVVREIEELASKEIPDYWEGN